MKISWRFIIVPSRSSGKVVLKVKVNKKNVIITFVDRTKLECVNEVLASFYIYEGKTLTDKEFKDIKAFNASASLMKYALSLLRKGHYSEWKMREKLYAKEGTKSDVDLVIKRLKANDLINDKMLILDHIEYGNERNIGKNKIIQELLNKGFFMENIPQSLFNHINERRKALANLPKLEKKYDKYAYEGKKQHIYKALLSLGFESDIALEVMNKTSLPKAKEENDKLKKDFDKAYIKYKRNYDGYDLKNKVISSLKSKGYRLNDIMKMWEKSYGENDF